MQNSSWLLRGACALSFALSATLLVLLLLSTTSSLDSKAIAFEKTRLARGERLEQIAQAMAATPLKQTARQTKELWREQLAALRDEAAASPLGKKSRQGAVAARLDFVLENSPQSAWVDPSREAAELLPTIQGEQRNARETLAMAEKVHAQDNLLLSCVFLGVLGVGTQRIIRRSPKLRPSAVEDAGAVELPVSA